MRWDCLTDLEFPNYPKSLLKNDEVLSSYAKSNAYVTIALEESNINHNRSTVAAIMSDITHDLEVENKEYSSREYLMDAQLEIDNIIKQVESHDRFIRDLSFVQETIDMALNPTY